jgi:hypothetical protein
MSATAPVGKLHHDHLVQHGLMDRPTKDSLAQLNFIHLFAIDVVYCYCRHNSSSFLGNRQKTSTGFVKLAVLVFERPPDSRRPNFVVENLSTKDTKDH